MASAHPSTSSGRTKRAASPATSRSAGMSAHTTAVPCAIASSTGMPNPSCRLGNANRSAPAKSANRCSRPTGPSRRTRSPSACRGERVTVVGFPSRWAGQHESVRHRAGVEPRRTRRAAPSRSCAAGRFRPRTRTAGRRSRRPGVHVRRRRRVARLEIDAVGDDADPLPGDRRVRRDLVGAELRHRDHQTAPACAAAAKP